MIDRLQGFFGFTKMPFGRDLAPSMMHRHGAHGEATARITWCVTERALGVITGEVGVGKTSRPGPRSPPWTPLGTSLSTSATPTSASAASTPPSSPRWAASPNRTRPP
ncbi:hypothetical protein [Nonomuraea sp. NPDC003709]|uniref:hypothetical protein n=1 Tax=Nonomuraea sp. NPDC003709 TaxID=3154450 RepID=UPI0033BC1298